MKTQLIATHLNAPYGAVVTAAAVEKALKTGEWPSASEDPGSMILASLFAECSPEILTACAAELQIPLENLQRLYEALTLQNGGALHRSREWETAWAEFTGDD